MPKRRADRVPTWLLVLNGARPALSSESYQGDGDGGPLRLVKQEGPIDVMGTRRGRALLAGMRRICDALFGAPLEDLQMEGKVLRTDPWGGEFEMGNAQIWGACRDLFDPAHPPLSRGYFPSWLPTISVMGTPLRVARRTSASHQYPALSLRLRDGLSAEDAFLARIAADFYRDIALFLVPGVDRRRMGRCAAEDCSRLFVRSQLPSGPEKERKGSVHAFCADACRVRHERPMRERIRKVRATRLARRGSLD